jgi:hypothetical protein
MDNITYHIYPLWSRTACAADRVLGEGMPQKKACDPRVRHWARKPSRPSSRACCSRERHVLSAEPNVHAPQSIARSVSYGGHVGTLAPVQSHHYKASTDAVRKEDGNRKRSTERNDRL